MFMELYGAMSRHFGPCHWWPASSPFEVVIGAVLTQNTAWHNVEKALANLREKKALSPEALWNMELDELEECLRPSGFFRLKAKRLRNLLAWLTEFEGWDASPANLKLNFLRGTGTKDLRRGLLAVTGIGPETADCILLYALQRESFVVDAYTKRIFSRHGFFPSDMAYEDIRSLFMRSIPQDVHLYNEYHALIVRTGNTFCKKSNPLCSRCPLGYLLKI